MATNYDIRKSAQLILATEKYNEPFHGDIAVITKEVMSTLQLDTDNVNRNIYQAVRRVVLQVRKQQNAAVTDPVGVS